MSGFWAAGPPWSSWVIVGCLTLLGVVVGAYWGLGRGWDHAMEEVRWQRAQARARTWQGGHGGRGDPGTTSFLGHETTALPLEILPGLEPLAMSHEEWKAHAKAPTLDPVLEPTAVLTSEEMSWTGEIARMTAAFQADMERILGGTDQQLTEITR